MSRAACHLLLEGLGDPRGGGGGMLGLYLVRHVMEAE